MLFNVLFKANLFHSNQLKMKYKNSLTMAPHFVFISHIKVKVYSVDNLTCSFYHQQMLFNTHLCPNILLSR